MKKWTVFLLTAILAAGLLAGCQPQGFQPTYPEGVTKEKLEEINAAHVNYTGIKLSWYHIDGYGCYYLGSENGYDIYYDLHTPSPNEELIITSDTVKMYTYTIGSASFYPCCAVNLWVHKGGSFWTLGQCYRDGLISEDAVLLAKERFDAYMQILKNMDPDVYWQRERKYRLSILDPDFTTPKQIEYLKNGSESLEYAKFQELFQAVSEE